MHPPVGVGVEAFVGGTVGVLVGGGLIGGSGIAEGDAGIESGINGGLDVVGIGIMLGAGEAVGVGDATDPSMLTNRPGPMKSTIPPTVSRAISPIAAKATARGWRENRRRTAS